MTGPVRVTVTRRTALAFGGATVATFAGCLGGPEPSGPRHRIYTLTITRPDEALELRIEPAGEVADVIQVRVGDTVEFTVVNETAVQVGFHNHADDVEFVVEPGDQREVSFEATEAMTGRQEIEGWVAEAGQEEEGERGGHGGGEATLGVIEVRPRSS